MLSWLSDSPPHTLRVPLLFTFPSSEMRSVLPGLWIITQIPPRWRFLLFCFFFSFFVRSAGEKQSELSGWGIRSSAPLVFFIFFMNLNSSACSLPPVILIFFDSPAFFFGFVFLFLPGFTDKVMAADFISCSSGLEMFTNWNMVLHSHTLRKKNQTDFLSQLFMKMIVNETRRNVSNPQNNSSSSVRGEELHLNF